MENTNQVVYIIDIYSQFSLDKIVDVFYLNNRWWAIKEVNLEWGIPQLQSIEEDDPMSFHIYNTLDEAKEYVHSLKKLEGVRF